MILPLLVALQTTVAFGFSPNSHLGSAVRVPRKTPASSPLHARYLQHQPSRLFLSSINAEGNELGEKNEEQDDHSITNNAKTSMNMIPVFDFTGEKSLDDKIKSVASFERIDDAIMGGISLSALKDVEGQPYASWSGVCRTDGGGFCGMRTLPFKEPLIQAKDQDGIYLISRLASDNEPDRRVWKMTIRTDSSRGEQVYQSEFKIPKQVEENEWTKVHVPFDSFKMVRGPRMVPDGPPLDLSNGIYQIGMTLSKFLMGLNTTTLEDFRPGYFELQVQQIGFYNTEGGKGIVDSDEKVMESVTDKNRNSPLLPDTLSKEEADKKRPLILKLLLPIAKLFFSEKSNRRRSAMNILRQKRNMSRSKAILFGIKSRRKSMGLVRSVGKTIGIVSVDVSRTIVKEFLKVVVGFPLKMISKLIRAVKKKLGMKVKVPLTE